MTIDKEKDPVGCALSDYHQKGWSDTLRVFNPEFGEDHIPVDYFFRSLDSMSSIEQKALSMSKGRILDVGAGAGCHSLVLQQMHKNVTAVEISELSAKVMTDRGVKNVINQDFFTLEDKFDTILMLMNGIGIVGSIDKLPYFFRHIDKVLSENGQLLFDSSDISSVFSNKDSLVVTSSNKRYYGELEYQMQYGLIKGETFPCLYIDFTTFQSIADISGFKAKLIQYGDTCEYLAQVTRA